MNELDQQPSQDVIVTNPLGLHARPAAMIAKLAMKATSNVWIIKNGDHVDASSIIDILSLACEEGSRITLKADSAADGEILDEIKLLFEKGFDE